MIRGHENIVMSFQTCPRRNHVYLYNVHPGLWNRKFRRAYVVLFYGTLVFNMDGYMEDLEKDRDFVIYCDIPPIKLSSDNYRWYLFLETMGIPSIHIKPLWQVTCIFKNGDGWENIQILKKKQWLVLLRLGKTSHDARNIIGLDINLQTDLTINNELNWIPWSKIRVRITLQ